MVQLTIIPISVKCSISIQNYMIIFPPPLQTHYPCSYVWINSYTILFIHIGCNYINIYRTNKQYQIRVIILEIKLRKSAQYQKMILIRILLNIGEFLRCIHKYIICSIYYYYRQRYNHLLWLKFNLENGKTQYIFIYID